MSFNLTVHGNPLSKELSYLKDIVNSIHQEPGNIGLLDWLTSWLPDMSWLKQLFVTALILYLLYSYAYVGFIVYSIIFLSD